MAERKRRLAVVLFIVVSVLGGYAYEAIQQRNQESVQQPAGVLGVNGELGPSSLNSENTVLARDALRELEVKGRAPKTGYTRPQFGEGWGSAGACDVRNFILRRE